MDKLVKLCLFFLMLWINLEQPVETTSLYEPHAEYQLNKIYGLPCKIYHSFWFSLMCSLWFSYYYSVLNQTSLIYFFCIQMWKVTEIYVSVSVRVVCISFTCFICLSTFLTSPVVLPLGLYRFCFSWERKILNYLLIF